MKRRDFIAGLGSVAAWPFMASAQQRPLPVIGWLHSQTLAGISPERIRGFHRGLAELGYVEGRNVAIEYRWAESHNDRLGALAADLVASRVMVIVALGSTAAALAAKAATDKIPIVFTSGADPVEVGLVASLNRPSGNITGVALLNNAVAGKRLAILREIVPLAATVALLTNSTNPGNGPEKREVAAAAAALGVRLAVTDASDPSGIEAAFERFARQPVDAVIVSADPLFTARRVQLAVLAARHRLPTIHQFRESVEAGGLISYGAVAEDEWRQTGVYVGRILKGTRPAELPIIQPTQFQLVINLATAKALRIEIPETLLATADEVIQ